MRTLSSSMSPYISLIIPLIVVDRWRSVIGCEIGLTQMRYQQTLALMLCTPRLPGEPDPCIEMTGGMNTFCQVDFPGNQYICCGTSEQLIAILTASIVEIPAINTSTEDPIPSTRTTLSLPDAFLQPLSAEPPFQRPSPATTHAPVTVNYNLPINNGSYGYPGLLPPSTNNNNNNRPLPPQIQSNLYGESPVHAIAIDTSIVGVNAAYGTPPPQGLPQRPGPIGINPPITLYAGLPIVNGIEKIEEGSSENGPMITLISSAHFAPGNVTNSWIAPAMVVLLQDGPCSIVVNTGLPVQRNEIVASLAAKGITGNVLDYTVVTSGHPQFIGNVNLFPSSHFVVGMFIAFWTDVSVSPLSYAATEDLCSENTQMIHTPGPTPDAITVIARNVPGMGTVAITGALFLDDDRLTHVNRAFVWDERQLIESRRKIICMSNWIIPGHSVPIPITAARKMQANCPTT